MKVQKTKKVSRILIANFIGLTLLIFFASLATADNAFSKVYTFGIIGDVGQYATDLTFLQSSLHESDIKNLIMVGDNAPNIATSSATYPAIWNSWIDEFNFMAVAVGNHNQGYKREMDYFKMPGDFYSIVPENDLLIIVLNSDEENKTRIEEQMKFIQDQLESANQKMILIAFHHPPADVGPKHTWKEKKSFFLKLVPILKKFKTKIDAILVGHEHVATFVDFDGIPLFVSPSVVGPREGKYYDKYYRELETKATNKWVYTGKINRDWLKLEVNTDDDSMLFSYINIDKKNRSDCSIVITSNVNAQSDNKRYLLQDNCQKNSL
ncbi:MAG: metallophosphoesterase [Oligoflexia bacterium]|nr:metallophosphoesterase [Oligoflexia bacterium]